MIEKINGAGLSGMTEKSTKSGKSSLFSKLLAMLEKNAEASGKGKGLQLNVDKSGKTKALAGLTEKADSAAVGKGQKIFSLASKEKSDILDQTDEAAVPLFAAHVIIDTTDKTKKLGQIGKTSLLIGGQVADQLGGKDGSNGGEKGAGLGAQKGAEKGAGLGAQKGAEQASDKVDLNRLSAKTDSGNTVLNQKKNLTSGQGNDLLSGQFKGELSKQGQMLETDPARMISNRPVVEATVAGQKDHGAEQAVKAASGANPGQFEATLNSGQATTKRMDSSTTSRFVVEGEKEDAALQVNHAREKKSAAKASSEATNVAAGAQFQKVKAAAQSQQIPASATVVSASTIGLAEASAGDLGSQLSDHKGGQSAQSLNAMLGDVKSTSSSSSANFQTYLTSKSAPTMSIFDSMNHIAQSAKNGHTRLEIQLDPANLGKIQISLQSDGSKQLQVHMVVDQGMTRAALEQQLPQLRSALAQQGFDLSGFSMDSQGQQGQQASSGGDGSRSNGGSNHVETVMGDSQTAQHPQQAGSGPGLSIRV